MRIPDSTLEQLGFKFGKDGAHSARTTMLDELGVLFESTGPETTKDAYLSDIIACNILKKGTDKSRALTGRHLVNLYTLDVKYPLFRIFRKLWEIEPQARPLLALQIAWARDPILRLSSSLILEADIGEQVVREHMEKVFDQNEPGRYSPASLKSIAQNVNGSWTRAGYLQGRAHKTRSLPSIYTINVVYALFQAYLQGATGERLLTSPGTRLLCLANDSLLDMAASASHQGLIDFHHSGGVLEIRFPDFLTAEEQEWLHG